MKKRSLIVVALLVLALCMAMVACGGGTSNEEKAPSVTITSGEGNITTAETYKLAYTTTDAKKEEVTVSGGTYNGETKEFSATEAGEYTITVKVTNVKKTAEAKVKVNVTEAGPAADTTAPEITFATYGDLTVKVNTPLTLPAATVIDDTDGDITDSLEVGADPQQGTRIVKASKGVYTFEAEAAGEYGISYYVLDEAENEAEEFLTVTVTPETTETNVIAADENNIENLAVSQKTFKENFEKGYNSPFAKGLNYSAVPKASISGGNDAIAGNSLILDYGDAEPTTNTAFYFSAVDSHIKAGRWTVKMDIKVISGTVPAGSFYLAFTEHGGDNLDKAYTIKQDGITKIEYDAIRQFDSGKEYWFRCAWFGSNPNYENFKIAIDNIEITWKDVEDATVKRTGEPVALTATDLDGEGYTITGTDSNYTAIGGSGNPNYVQIDKLVTGDLLNAEQAANLTEANGFNSPYAIYFTGQINNFNALQNLCNDPAYSYTLTLKVYSVGSGWNIFMTNAGNAQTGASGVSGTGVQTWTHTFDGKEGYVNIGMYNGGSAPLFIGDIKISRKVKEVPVVNPMVTRTGSQVTITAAQLDGDGYTITGADNNYTNVTSTQQDTFGHVQIDKLVDGKYLTAEQAANLTAANGFNSAYAIYFEGELKYFSALKNLFGDTGYTYGVTVKMYIPKMTGNIHLFKDGSSVKAFGKQTGAYTLTVEGIASGSEIGIYIEGGSGNFYVGDIKVSRKAKEVPAVNPMVTRTGTTVAITADQLDGNGYKITGADGNYTTVTSNQTDTYGYVQIDKLVAGKYLTEEQAANLTAANGFNSDYALYLEGQLKYFDSLNNLCSDNNYTYTLTIKLYVVDYSGNIHVFDENSSTVSTPGGDNGVRTITVSNFEAKSKLGLYFTGKGKIFIGDITIQRTAK